MPPDNRTPKHVGNLPPREYRGTDGTWTDAPVVYACPICGAVVLGAELHETWHDNVVEALLAMAHGHGVPLTNKARERAE